MMTLSSKLGSAETGQSEAPKPKSAFNFTENKANMFGEIAKRWNDLLTAERKPLFERYAEGSVSLVCNLRVIRSSDLQLRDEVIDNTPWIDSVFFTSLIFNTNADNLSKLGVRDQQLMLIHNVEQVKTPQGLPIPSSVGLYHILDTFVDLSRGLVLCKSAFNGCYKSLAGFTDRKFRETSPLASPKQLHFAHGIVEGRPQIVDSISEDERESKWQRFYGADSKKVTTAFDLVIHHDNVVCCVREEREYVIQFIDVLFGPINLGPGLFE
jgi:hypothetical protein